MKGNLLLRMNRVSDSIAPISRALELREALVKEHPDDESYHIDLAVSLIQKARLGVAQGNADTALDGLKRAKTILGGIKKKRDNAFYNRACLLAQEGAALAHLGRDAGHKALAQLSFDAAIEALRQAIAAGYDDRTSLPRDLDLDPIRARDDFQALLADLAFPADPIRF